MDICPGAAESLVTPVYMACTMQVPIYASYLHDAVTVYATALRHVLRGGADVRNGTAIAANIKGRIYESESAR